jgi:haloacetate dehalogenase
MFDHFQPFEAEISPVVTLRGRAGGRRTAPPLLLMHGHPQTHLMWHRMADELARDFFVVAADLRGYGESSRPATTADHRSYSKRAMASDAVALMRTFGVERFAVAAHDRGARVAARLAVDHPHALSAALLMDIAPTLDMYACSDPEFAKAYWHWFFLIQPAPLPESLIEANPRAYVEGVLLGRHAGLAPFPEEILSSYVAAVTGPGQASGLCEDYRAAATCDLDDDRQDRESGVLIPVPLRVLWAEHGVIARHFDPLELWRQIASNVSGRALDCGHYLPEEKPGEVLTEIREFLLHDPGQPQVKAV